MYILFLIILCHVYAAFSVISKLDSIIISHDFSLKRLQL